MKKFIILGLALLIGACSNSDENSSNNNASIVGTWEYVKDVTIFCDGSEEVFYYSECNGKYWMIEFKSNGAFTVFGVDENCDVYVKENGTYRITYDFFESQYDFTSDVLWLYYPESETFELLYHLYELSSNILKYGENYAHTGNPCNVVGEDSYYYYELVRVE
jgi:hypothetical protein